MSFDFSLLCFGSFLAHVQDVNDNRGYSKMGFDGFMNLLCKALLAGSAGVLIWCALSIASRSRREKALLEMHLQHRRVEPKEYQDQAGDQTEAG
jgi:hypothetical protein